MVTQRRSGASPSWDGHVRPWRQGQGYSKVRPRRRDRRIGFDSAQAIQKSAWYNGDMEGPDIGSGGRWLRGVAVRPVRGVGERRRWDALMREPHYLPYRGLFGRLLRQVAVRGGDLARAAGLAGRGVQGRGARRVDRLDAGAAVLAAAPGGEQRPLRGAGPGPGSEPGVAGAGAGSAAAVAGHAGRARASGAAGGDVRGPVAFRRDVLPGVELGAAGAHAGLFAGTGRAGALARARPAEGGVRVRDGEGPASRETAYGLTSLGPGQAGPGELAALVRHHWHIENRLHHVRDFTCDEDRCRARVGNLPRNLACPTNAAISIVRHERRFEHLPPANRHYAARPREALDAVLDPPSR